MNVNRFVGSCFVVLFAASLACGQLQGIYVEYYHPQNGWLAVPHVFPQPPFPNRHNLEPGLPSGSSIEIYNPTAVPYRVFAVDPSNTDIGSIWFGPSQHTTQLIIGRESTQVNPGQQLPTAGARHIGNINGLNVYKLRLQARVQGAM